MSQRLKHAVNIPGPLWNDLLALQQSRPSLCPNPSNFILDATRDKVALVHAGLTERVQSPQLSPPPQIGGPRVIPPQLAIGEDAGEVLTAIANAGSTGITAKQLSSVTGLPPNSVEERLGSLSSGQRISKFGRGLWVLHKYADAGVLGPGGKGAPWYDSRFESNYGVRLGSYSGDIQFSPNERLPVHRWWPYVQGFSAAFVTDVCKRLGIGKGTVVLDPFCGSGTVPVVARMLGARAIGIDMLPIVAFVADAKCEWAIDPDSLVKFAGVVVADRSPSSLRRPFLRETSKQFRDDVLQSLLRLKENILSVESESIRKLLRLAFSSILIDCSNLKRAPCLGYAKKAGLNADTPYRLFESAAGRISEDLRTIQQTRDTWGPPAEILLGSSGEIRLPVNSVDLAITSPPYVNGMDYPTNYKLDLAWLDFIQSYEQLASLRASMVACDNIPRRTATEHRPCKIVEEDEWIKSVVDSIDRNIRSKGTYRRADMPAIVRKYFDDLVPVISNVFAALRPGGRFVVVNGDSLIAGTYIPGDMIFARLAMGSGFAVESVDVARTRRSGQRRGFTLRETVTTLTKPKN